MHGVFLCFFKDPSTRLPNYCALISVYVKKGHHETA